MPLCFVHFAVPYKRKVHPVAGSPGLLKPYGTLYTVVSHISAGTQRAVGNQIRNASAWAGARSARSAAFISWSKTPDSGLDVRRYPHGTRGLKLVNVLYYPLRLSECLLLYTVF